MNNPVVWFEIYVDDMPRAKAFYEKLLDVTLTRLEDPGDTLEMWAFPMAPEGGGASGALVKMAGVPPGGGSVIVYFTSQDCAVEAGRAEAAGGRVLRPKMSIGQYGHIALLSDTEGNTIGVHSME
jgi:predicted enzyme related to lactoylglutathione lyase